MGRHGGHADLEAQVLLKDRLNSNAQRLYILHVYPSSSPGTPVYSLGVALGQGRAIAEVLGERRSVTEGVTSAAAVTALARRHGVELPICQAVEGLVNNGADLDDIIAGLLSRPFTTEAPKGTK